MSDFQILISLRQSARPNELAARSLWPQFRAIAFDWTCIILAIATLFFSQWWMHPVFLAIIAARQHALLIIMHDASHFSLTTKKWLNDLIGDLFCAFPFLITTSAYRTNHIAHHEHLNSAQDPDLIRKLGPAGNAAEWMSPMPLRRALSLVGRDAVGFGLVSVLMNIRKFNAVTRSKQSDRAEYPYAGTVRAAYFVCAALTVGLSEKPLFLLYAWFVPLLLLVPVLLRLRGFAEHFSLPKRNLLSHSRNVEARWIERFLLAPHQTCLHLDHHLFPYVPWYRLPELHARLRTNSIYCAEAHINTGYFLGRRSVVFVDMQTITDDPRPAALVRAVSA